MFKEYVMQNKKFLSFLEGIRESSPSLIEGIEKAYKVIMESEYKKEGTTSENEGHDHKYKMDDAGEGETSMDKGHKHKIVDEDVLDAGNPPHNHDLEKK